MAEGEVTRSPEKIADHIDGLLKIPMPSHNADFTPALARDIILMYRRLLAEAAEALRVYEKQFSRRTEEGG